MSKKMTERQIEKILVDEVKKLGGRAYKWTSPGNNGVPDRIVFLPGHTAYFVELKTDAGELSPLQRIQVDRLKGLGQKVWVAKGVDGVSQFFQDIGLESISRALDCRYEL